MIAIITRDEEISADRIGKCQSLCDNFWAGKKVEIIIREFFEYWTGNQNKKKKVMPRQFENNLIYM